ncbi:MAG: hypothetical protein QF773_00130 [Lentisphaeria bacterium]|jgi:hypothetical protein|nr:hypothetical protein [Lentisphaeria bacterium]
MIGIVTGSPIRAERLSAIGQSAQIRHGGSERTAQLQQVAEGYHRLVQLMLHAWHDRQGTIPRCDGR